VEEIRVKIRNLVGLEKANLKVSLQIFTVNAHLNYSDYQNCQIFV